MKKEVWILFFMNMFNGMGYSILSPLLPILGNASGLSEEILGWIISTYALVSFSSAPFVPNMCLKFGRIKVLYFGTFCSATCTFIYGILNHIKSFYFLIMFIFLVRALHGMSNGIIVTIIYSLTSSISDKDNVQTALGYLEMAISLGIAGGPLCASLLYSIGGYSLPFIALGTFLYISVFLTKKLNANIKENNNEKENGSININNNESNSNFLSFIVYLQIILLLGATAFNLIATTFYFPSLTNHLTSKFGLSVSVSSLFFMLTILSYFISLQFIEQTTKKLGLYFSIFLSIFLFGLSCFFIYPVSIIPNCLPILIFGLVGIGLATPPSLVTVIVLLSEHIKKIDPNMNDYYVNDMASALFNSFISVGDFIGPIIGGFFSHHYGFNYSCFYVSIIIVGYSFIFLGYFIKDIFQDIKVILRNRSETQNIKDIFLLHQNQDEQENSNIKRRISFSNLARIGNTSFKINLIKGKKYTALFLDDNKISNSSYKSFKTVN